MFLSIQQKFILDTLKKLNCVRQRQLQALVRGRFQQNGFEITQARMDAMLRQLRTGTADVRLDDGLVWLSSAQPDSRRLEAIDVMLELTGGKPQELGASRGLPRLLRFAYGRDELRPFTVASLDAAPAELAGAGHSGAHCLDRGQRRAPQRADATAQALFCRPPAGRDTSLLWL